MQYYLILKLKCFCVIDYTTCLVFVSENTFLKNVEKPGLCFYKKDNHIIDSLEQEYIDR